MRFIGLIHYFLFCFLAFSQADDNTPLSLVQEQLEGYNNRDIDAFLVPFSDSVKVYDFLGEMRYSGKNEMRKRYSKMFEERKDLSCEVVNRIILNNTVIDHEEVVIDKTKPKLKAIAIYTVENGKIDTVTFIH